MQLDHPVVQKNHHLLKPPHVQIQTTHYALGGFAVGGSFTQQGSLIVPQVFLFCLSNWTVFQQKNTG